tara:strand:+ start:11384 stop:13138 length:1755 start_codon:yes stop_codon:yes gene_type:complete
MALSTPSASPAVVVKEIDLTGGVPNVQSTTGAIVGNYRWGPAEERVLVDNEATLVNTFASPDSDNTIDFHSAVYFLRYSGSLFVTREVDGSALNARSTRGQLTTDSDGSLPTELVKNEQDWNAQTSALDSDSHTFIARFPGELGNSLQVSICPPSDSAFNAWSYASDFDAAPGTSDYASDRNAANDEVHMVIVDKNGEFTGTKGTVLETYPFVSMATDAKNADGTTNYGLDIINNRSEYVWMVDWDSDYQAARGNGYVDSGDTFMTALNSDTDFNFAQGVNSGMLGTTEYLQGYDLYEDKDIVEIDFLISPSMNSRTDQTTIVNDLISTAQSLRKDCVVAASPARTDVLGLTNTATMTNNIVATANTYTNSSYLVNDGNFLKIYDKYNDQYINIPAASSTAGIMAATDLNRAPWFSPAGSRRGQYLGITAIAYSPTKAQRDTLYKASVNPIANIPGQGVLLFGDKTKLGRPSAFDRINVRRLFLVLERAIGRAAEQVMFEFNDEFTRAEFVNIVEPVLREVQGRRGITDFRVVCDETNNTPAVVDRNEFIANIFIKPARSINYVTLNFVAVRTGVDFEEVVGTV